MAPDTLGTTVNLLFVYLELVQNIHTNYLVIPYLGRDKCSQLTMYLSSPLMNKQNLWWWFVYFYNFVISIMMNKYIDDLKHIFGTRDSKPT